MGFKNWLIFHASAAGIVLVGLFVALIGVSFMLANQPIIGIVVLVISGITFMYARYRYREYDIHTQQRKHGFR
jgi:uncharacterized membrane-anchored protein